MTCGHYIIINPNKAETVYRSWEQLNFVFTDASIHIWMNILRWEKWLRHHSDAEWRQKDYDIIQYYAAIASMFWALCARIMIWKTIIEHNHTIQLKLLVLIYCTIWRMVLKSCIERRICSTILQLKVSNFEVCFKNEWERAHHKLWLVRDFQLRNSRTNSFVIHNFPIFGI